ncbi:MAG: histidine--tRNA ligase [Chitinophagaceae bacterium]|nr:histidine--tRNA ligase [Chitinophagaceae bacterium]
MTQYGNPAEGMRDFLPKDVALRHYVTNTILGVYNEFGFTQIETPCVERIDILSHSDGGENEKMLFKILKRGEKLQFSDDTKESDVVDLGLRYDLTVPLCRFYANNRSRLPNPFKVIQMGSVWRAERSQKGRYRQFTQCDIDIIGNNSIMAEIELILATAKALQKLGFQGFKIRINDRRILECLAKYCGFEESSFQKVFVIFDKLDKIGKEGVKKELEDAKFSSLSIDKFMNTLERTTESGITVGSVYDVLPSIPKEIFNDLVTVISTVSAQAGNEYSIYFDISLVRGMGYYTGQIFEIEMEGYKSSIAGGGRYNKMIGKILQEEKEVPACGFSIGFERVIALLEERNFEIPHPKKKLTILYKEDIGNYTSLLEAAQRYREKGYSVSLEMQKKNVKKQLDDLGQRGFHYFAFFEGAFEMDIKELK